MDRQVERPAEARAMHATDKTQTENMNSSRGGDMRSGGVTRKKKRLTKGAQTKMIRRGSEVQRVCRIRGKSTEIRKEAQKQKVGD